MFLGSKYLFRRCLDVQLHITTSPNRLALRVVVLSIVDLALEGSFKCSFRFGSDTLSDTYDRTVKIHKGSGILTKNQDFNSYPAILVWKYNTFGTSMAMCHWFFLMITCHLPWTLSELPNLITSAFIFGLDDRLDADIEWLISSQHLSFLKQNTSLLGLWKFATSQLAGTVHCPVDRVNKKLCFTVSPNISHSKCNLVFWIITLIEIITYFYIFLQIKCWYHNSRQGRFEPAPKWDLRTHAGS